MHQYQAALQCAKLTQGLLLTSVVKKVALVCLFTSLQKSSFEIRL